MKKDTETYSRVDKRVLGYEGMVYLSVCEISNGILSRQVGRQVGFVELFSGGTRRTVGSYRQQEDQKEWWGQYERGDKNTKVEAFQKT